jgi:hypothetical protein
MMHDASYERAVEPNASCFIGTVCYLKFSLCDALQGSEVACNESTALCIQYRRFVVASARNACAPGGVSFCVR